MTEERPLDPEIEQSGEHEPQPSGGALTGATGSLAPDELEVEPFVPGERREIADPELAGRVTAEQRRYAAGRDAASLEDDGSGPALEGPTVMAQEAGGYGSRHGLAKDDPAYRVDAEPDTAPRASGPAGGDSDTHAEAEERY